MIPARWFRFVLPFWVLALVVGSFLPAERKQALGTQSITPRPYAEPHWPHRVWHIVSFGSTALLACLAETSRPRRRLLWALLVIALGASIETAQWLGNDYSFEWWDVRDDAYGVLICAVLAELRPIRRVLVAE
jgi:hypothetical protein